MTRILVWQWSRRGGPPMFGRRLADALAGLAGVQALLSLSTAADLMQEPDAPACALPYRTYTTLPGFLWRFATAPLQLPGLISRLRRLRPDLAICAQPGPLDLVMAAALRLLGIPYYVVVHDAEAHPGDGFPLLHRLQRLELRLSHGVVALSAHVGRRLAETGALAGRRLILSVHPPYDFGPMPPPPLSHGGRLRLLFFGRLLPYKGLDMLADAAALLGDDPGLELRVVGQGPEAVALDRLRAIAWARVENRWVPDDELGSLIGWADALVLPYTEASQSGVAAAAIAARRFVVATKVGGLVEQFAGEPLARLCPPDAASVADAIASLRRDPPLPGHTATPSWHDMAAALLASIQAAPDRAN